MKGAVVLLEKGGVLIRTQYTAPQKVLWWDGEKTVAEIFSLGFEIVQKNKHIEALDKLEKLRDSVCWGYKPTNNDFLEIIKLLREY